MARLSLPALAAAFSVVAAQQGLPTAVPDVTTPSANSCGGCYVVADVAGIVFGGVYTTTQTNVVGVGRNGTTITTSVIDAGSAQATFNSNGPVAGGTVTSFNSDNSVITVGGATLTSPTQYEVFSAYSVISTVSGANGCVVTTATPVALNPASKYIVDGNAGTDALLAIEKSFIADIGFPSCSVAGQVVSTVHSQITTATTSTTVTGTLTPAPASAPTYVFPNISAAAPTATITPANSGSSLDSGAASFAGLLAAGAALVFWL